MSTPILLSHVAIHVQQSISRVQKKNIIHGFHRLIGFSKNCFIISPDIIESVAIYVCKKQGYLRKHAIYYWLTFTKPKSKQNNNTNMSNDKVLQGSSGKNVFTTCRHKQQLRRLPAWFMSPCSVSHRSFMVTSWTAGRHIWLVVKPDPCTVIYILSWCYILTWMI